MSIGAVGASPDILQLRAQLSSDRKSFLAHQQAAASSVALELDQARIQQDLQEITAAEPPRAPSAANSPVAATAAEEPGYWL